MNKKVWTTKNGEVIAIKDLSDVHLQNIIAMYRRRAQFEMNELIAHPPNFNGDMAQFYADRDYDALLEMDVDDYLEENELYQWLIEEQESRK